MSGGVSSGTRTGFEVKGTRVLINEREGTEAICFGPFCTLQACAGGDT